MTDFAALLRALTDAGVEFIVIGGVAAVAHGSAHITLDLDVVYARSAANLVRLANAVAPFSPRLRGAPEGLPFQFDPPTIHAGLNFTLMTSVGALDLLGEAAGQGSYENLLPRSVARELYGLSCRFVDLETLIHLKRAAGRVKDLERIAELEAIRDDPTR